MKNFASVAVLVASVMVLAGCPKPKEEPPAPPPETTAPTGVDTTGANAEDADAAGPSGELLSKRVVYFDFDRSTLRPEAHRILEPLLDMLRADPEMRIDIEGHTDWVGSDGYNQGLSERRARAVVNWLVAHGVERERITSVGRGESEPVATNATAQGRQLNRRVEIRRR